MKKLLGIHFRKQIDILFTSQMQEKGTLLVCLNKYSLKINKRLSILF